MSAVPSDVVGALRHRVTPVALSMSVAGLGVLLIERGLGLSPPPQARVAAVAVYTAAIVLFAAQAALAVAATGRDRAALGFRIVDAVVLAASLPLLLAGGRPRTAFAIVGIVQTLRVVAIAYRALRIAGFLEAMESRPFRLVALSFLATIVVGTALLSLPASAAGDDPIGLIDAAFTASSAVCVTGLITVSTPHAWSPFGQAVILALIQVGGFGIMAMSASVLFTLGGRLGARSRARLAGVTDSETVAGFRAAMRRLLVVTLAFEAGGAVVLFARFALDPYGWREALWLAVFHSVSAWNNAGFALWDDNLTAYVSDPVVNLVVSVLVIAGGLGMLVLTKLSIRVGVRHGVRAMIARWDLHARLSVATTAVLLVGGTLVLLFVEFDRGLAGLGPEKKLLAAFFHAMSARTAGFNTVDLATFTPLGLLTLCALMFVGACSGSTGGGIKTSTVAVLVLGLRANLRGRDDVSVFGRTIPQRVVLRAVGMAVIASAVVVLAFGFLLMFEPGRPFENLLFESVSAFATVGLSTGITPQLNGSSKILIAIVMFVGRIGPLSLALALGGRAPTSAVEYPEGRVVVG